MARRVLTGLFAHETNAFSKSPTTLAHYENFLLAFDEAVPDAIRGSVLELVGVEHAAQRYDWELIHTVAAWATPSGPVADDVWDRCAIHILDRAASSMPLDGVLLALHGAMATTTLADAEGELLRQLRRLIGNDVPVAITLDLHANVTDAMVEHSDVITAYRTYPHVDQIQTAQRAADLLQQTMNKEVVPINVVARRAMLTGLDDGRTTLDNPMTDLLQRADEIERANDGILMISVHAGFSPGDLDQAGPSVVVTADGEAQRERAREIAEGFMDLAWDTRHFDSNEYLDAPAVIAQAHRLLAKNTVAHAPIVIADFSDNPGAGAYGDSTLLLEALLDDPIPGAAVGSICDPASAAELVAAGTGETVSIELGGKIDTRFGAPLSLTGEVIAITDGSYVASGPRWRGVTQHLGPTAVFRVDHVDIIVASNRLQCTELELFSHAGIEPRARPLLMVKSMQHFRAAFEPIARTVLICDAGALATRDLSRFDYRRVRRPIFPLDLD